MTTIDPPPVLTIFRRPGCHLCDDAEMLLRLELQDRAAKGLVTPSIERVDVSTNPGLESRYGMRIPVIAVGDEEIELVTSGPRIRDLLDRNMPRLA